MASSFVVHIKGCNYNIIYDFRFIPSKFSSFFYIRQTFCVL